MWGGRPQAEAAHLLAFRRNFEEVPASAHAHFPRPLAEQGLVSRRVLVESWAEGSLPSRTFSSPPPPLTTPQEEEEPEGKWYYLGGNSVGELILNIIALGVAGVMLFNFLYAKGWWQKFCQPLLDWLLKICWPFLSVVGNFLKPGWDWWATNVYDFHHIHFMFENLTAVNASNGSISVHTRKVNDTSFLNQDPFKQTIFDDVELD